MKYVPKLVLRLIASFLLVFSSEFFYKALFYPMFYLFYFLLLPYSPSISGSTLIIDDKKLIFISACVAASAYILLAILVLLTKDISFMQGIKILILGYCALFIVNMIRIYFLALVLLKFDIKLFETLHLFFWQIFSTIFVILLWLFLVKYFKIKSIPIYSDFNYLFKKSR